MQFPVLAPINDFWVSLQARAFKSEVARLDNGAHKTYRYIREAITASHSERQDDRASTTFYLHGSRLPRRPLEKLKESLPPNSFQSAVLRGIAEAIQIMASGLLVFGEPEVIAVGEIEHVYRGGLLVGEEFSYLAPFFSLASLLATFAGLRISTVPGLDFLNRNLAPSGTEPGLAKKSVNHSPHRYGFGIQAVLEIIAASGHYRVSHGKGYLTAATERRDWGIHLSDRWPS